MFHRGLILDFIVLLFVMGSCHKRQKPQASAPQALLIRNYQTRKFANAKVRNRYTNKANLT